MIKRIRKWWVAKRLLREAVQEINRRHYSLPLRLTSLSRRTARRLSALHKNGVISRKSYNHYLKLLATDELTEFPEGGVWREAVYEEVVDIAEPTVHNLTNPQYTPRSLLNRFYFLVRLFAEYERKIDLLLQLLADIREEKRNGVNNNFTTSTPRLRLRPIAVGETVSAGRNYSSHDQEVVLVENAADERVLKILQSTAGGGMCELSIRTLASLSNARIESDGSITYRGHSYREE